MRSVRGGRLDSECLAKLGLSGSVHGRSSLSRTATIRAVWAMLGVELMKRAKFGDGLGGQSVLDGPPGRGVAGREPGRLRLLAALGATRARERSPGTSLRKSSR